MTALHPNAQLVTDFYTAFNKQDPAFPNLRGKEVGDMWTMLRAAASWAAWQKRQ